MFRIILSWLLSIVIGSALFSLVPAIYDIPYLGFKPFLFFSIFYSFLSSLPILIIEIVFNISTVKNSKSYKEYTKAKFITATLIVLVILIISNLDVKEELFKKLIGVLIAICYGLPGTLLHYLFIKPLFFNKKTES
jgi:hypothetical protein